MIEIEVYSDVVCPWCFIGKRHLDSALATFQRTSGAQLALTWRAFQLNPQLPPQGMPRKTYVETKFGGAQRAAAIYQRVSDAGRAAGIDFAFDKIVTQPNTLNAHRLIRYAHASGQQDAMVTRVFNAYFLEGADLTDIATLAHLAAEAGLDPAQAQAYLCSDENAAEVADEDAQAHSMGIEGVPFFIVANRYAVSGAQPPEALLQVLERALQDMTSKRSN
jgi:predicted DsbA family dithiol-disulfide isomerase